MDREAANADAWVVLARVGRPHGIKGWVKIHSYTEPPENISSYGHFCAEIDGRLVDLEMDQLTDQGNSVIAHFTGYDQPEQVKELVGVLLKVPVAELPVLPEGEYYWHQLIGLRVMNLQGEFLGQVQKILETGANDVLVVEASEGSLDDKERLVPYLKERVIKRVDLEQERIEVDWEADY